MFELIDEGPEGEVGSENVRDGIHEGGEGIGLGRKRAERVVELLAADLPGFVGVAVAFFEEKFLDLCFGQTGASGHLPDHFGETEKDEDVAEIEIDRSKHIVFRSSARCFEGAWRSSWGRRLRARG